MAEDIREVGVRMSGVTVVPWRSTAAPVLQSRLATDSAAVRRAAEAVDDLAGMLLRHARALDIAAQTPPARLLDAVGDVLNGVVGGRPMRPGGVP